MTGEMRGVYEEFTEQMESIVFCVEVSQAREFH